MKIENDTLSIKKYSEWVEISTMDQVNDIKPDD